MGQVKLYSSSSVPPLINRGSSAGRFNITWKEGRHTWGCSAVKEAMPYNTAKLAVTELLNRDSGRTFLIPVLKQICPYPLIPERVFQDINITYINEGTDAGILRVDVKVPTEGNSWAKRSFCLNVAIHPKNNALIYDIHQAIKYFRTIDARHIVKPLAFGRGHTPNLGKDKEISILATEFLDGYVEVDMFNMAEGAFDGLPIQGLESIGLRSIVLNDPMKPRPIEDQWLEGYMGQEMVRILTSYFNPTTGEWPEHFAINNGDFVYKYSPGNKHELRLITARKPGRMPVLYPGKPHFTAGLFIDYLLSHMENSVICQDFDDPRMEQNAIFVFTPHDVFYGIRKFLFEKHGPSEGKNLLLQWIACYRIVAESAIEARQYGRQGILRRRLCLTEMSSPFKEEFPGKVVVNI